MKTWFLIVILLVIVLGLAEPQDSVLDWNFEWGSPIKAKLLYNLSKCTDNARGIVWAFTNTANESYGNQEVLLDGGHFPQYLNVSTTFKPGETRLVLTHRELNHFEIMYLGLWCKPGNISTETFLEYTVLHCRANCPILGLTTHGKPEIDPQDALQVQALVEADRPVVKSDESLPRIFPIENLGVLFDFLVLCSSLIFALAFFVRMILLVYHISVDCITSCRERYGDAKKKRQ